MVFSLPRGLKWAVLLPVILLAGCFHVKPGVFDGAWNPAPEARIILATHCCGFVPYLAVLNDIPGAQVWGDGRVVWATVNNQGQRSVWEGRLQESTIEQWLKRAYEAGFFNWKDLYADQRVADAAPQCLEVTLLALHKQVCEYFSGAPQAFHELYDALVAGTGVQGTPYVPRRGYVQAHPIVFVRAPDPDEIDLHWPDDVGVSLKAVADGMWMEGEALQLAWQAANANPWANLVQSANGCYQLSVQVPGLSTSEPPTVP